MKYLIKGAQIINENTASYQDVLIENEIISKIAQNIQHPHAQEIHAEGWVLIPGLIDDQVHFREPGLTHKADIYTESRAAVAGGITSFMEMPNVIPQTTTHSLLEKKFTIASTTSLANHSFYLGATHNNIEEIVKTNPQTICGIKIFMGSSTGNMLVDDEQALENIFAKAPTLIATHCEDESLIQHNFKKYLALYGDDIPMACHPKIRSREACVASSSKAIALAKKWNSRLHILHISTAEETQLFSNQIPLKDKKITAEVCVHHLWFTDQDYETLKTKIKWNPAVKTAKDKEALWLALNADKLDILATDHAPHTWEEKSNVYTKSPSGGPLVQHALLALLEMVNNKKITIEKLVEKACHAPAVCFQIENRGFIKEGFYADMVLINPNKKQKVEKKNLWYKCQWSPFEGHTFPHTVEATFVSGHLAYFKGRFDESKMGLRLKFNR